MRLPSVYLDYAAATPLDPGVLAAMQPYFSEQFYNPSATYEAAQQVKAAIEQARRDVAQMLGARPTEIIFTAGGTEANNLALKGVIGVHPDASVLISSIEHESIRSLVRQARYQEIPVTPAGIIDIAALGELIGEDTVLLSTMYANNEVGTIQPMRDIAALVQAVRNRRRATHNTLPLIWHTDATQAANYLDLHVARLGVDLMTLNGGKIYGPKQTGVLYVRTGIALQPVVYGGGQERSLRSGTENVSGIIGFAAALQLAVRNRNDEVKRLQQLQTLFFQLLAAKVPTATITGSQTKRLPNNVHIVLPGEDNERLLMALDEAGVMAAAGSACSASNEVPSHVLMAMGLTEADAQSSLRFTLGRMTSETDIHRTVDVLARLVA